MSAPARLAAFAVAVLVAFGVGGAVGRAVGPIDVRDDPIEHPGPAPVHREDHRG